MYYILHLPTSRYVCLLYTPHKRWLNNDTKKFRGKLLRPHHPPQFWLSCSGYSDECKEIPDWVVNKILKKRTMYKQFLRGIQNSVNLDSKNILDSADGEVLCSKYIKTEEVKLILEEFEFIPL